MPKIPVNEQNIYYEKHGQGDPLILIAGLTCDTSIWETILEHLAAHFEVVIFDNRDIGKSDPCINPYSLLDMAHDTLGLANALKFKKFHVLGHSMGGAIAQHLAVLAPVRIHKLVLANTLIRFRRVSFLANAAVRYLRRDKVPEKLVVRLILPWLYSGNFLTDEKVEELVELASTTHNQSEASFQRQLNALTQFDSSQWYKDINLPTLVIAGDEDILCPFDSKLLASTIPSAYYCNMVNQSHVPMIEEPEVFSDMVINFLKNDRVYG